MKFFSDKIGLAAAALKNRLIPGYYRSGIEPRIWKAEIISTHPHLRASYTQGLEFHEGGLFESTGMKGQSKVAQVELGSGNHIRAIDLGPDSFGEGITVLGDMIYQLTWQEGRCLVYEKRTFRHVKDLAYDGEGWGMCNDGSSIIMSDGSERIMFRDPSSFEILRTIRVRDRNGPVIRLNELEHIDGLIFANVLMSTRIVVIDPRNGIVIAELDGTEIERLGRGDGDEMNGIAHDPTTGRTYFTGKRWPRMVETVIKKQ